MKILIRLLIAFLGTLLMAEAASAAPSNAEVFKSTDAFLRAIGETWESATRFQVGKTLSDGKITCTIARRNYVWNCIEKHLSSGGVVAVSAAPAPRPIAQAAPAVASPPQPVTAPMQLVRRNPVLESTFEAGSGESWTQKLAEKSARRDASNFRAAAILGCVCIGLPLLFGRLYLLMRPKKVKATESQTSEDMIAPEQTRTAEPPYTIIDRGLFPVEQTRPTIPRSEPEREPETKKDFRATLGPAFADSQMH